MWWGVCVWGDCGGVCMYCVVFGVCVYCEDRSIPVGATKKPGEGGMKCTGAKLAVMLWVTPFVIVLLLLFLFPVSAPIAPK